MELAWIWFQVQFWKKQTKFQFNFIWIKIETSDYNLWNQVTAQHWLLPKPVPVYTPTPVVTKNQYQSTYQGSSPIPTQQKV